MKPRIAAALGIIYVISVAIFLGGTAKDGLPEPITVGGETIAFTHTDETEKENLIIYSNQETYTDGFSHAVVYLAVMNESGVGQDVELNGYFIDDKRRITDVSVLAEVTTERLEGTYEERCVAQKGTSTSCTQVQTGTTTIQETANKWVPLELQNRTNTDMMKEDLALLEKVNVARKAVGEYGAKRKSSPYHLPAGKVLYYRLVVEFPPQGASAMYVEAVGSLGAYGFLY